jgi:F-type H+-transporting ATPase subunit epsilon
MKLSVITPEKMVVEEDDVEAVYGKTTDGMVGILPNHIPLVAPLTLAGKVSFVKNGQKRFLDVDGGLLSMDGCSVTVLSESVEWRPE